MFSKIKPISISLSPNVEKDDVFLSLKMIFQPWKWKKGISTKKIEEEFKKRFGARYAFSFNSGRSSLLAILNSLGKKRVLLQSFTCNAAVNPVIWSGSKPVYVDCDPEDFNIDIKDLKKKIGSGGEILIVQHTFGQPANMDEVLKICKEKGLILIEDCAHSLGSRYEGRLVGTFGKAAFFSFSRDKVVSSVYGGMVVTDDEEMGERIKEYRNKLKHPSSCWILQQLIHPVLMNWLILPTYRFLGKYLLYFFQKFFIFSKAVHWKEKRGKKPFYFPKKMPNALSVLALNQLDKLDRFNDHRKKIAKFYYDNLKNRSFRLPKNFEKRENIYLRFAVKHDSAHKIIRKAWDNNLLIGDWYTTPVAPEDTNLKKVHYHKGSCPKAEKLSKITLNLPTHINVCEEEARKILSFIENNF